MAIRLMAGALRSDATRNEETILDRIVAFCLRQVAIRKAGKIQRPIWR